MKERLCLRMTQQIQAHLLLCHKFFYVTSSKPTQNSQFFTKKPKAAAWYDLLRLL